MLRGFSGDEDVATALATFFREEHNFDHFRYNSEKWLPDNSQWFANHPQVANAVESHILHDKSHDSYYIAHAALLARTPNVKKSLLDRFRKSESFGYWPAWALLKGWGMADLEVATTLMGGIEAYPEMIASMGELVVDIFAVRQDARRRLLHCLNTERAEWPWLLLRSIIILDGDLRSPDVLEPCLVLMERIPQHKREIRRFLIEHAAPDPRVRDFALAEFNSHDGELSAVAEGFGEDVQIRNRLIAILAPLPIELRANIVDRLGVLPSSDPFALELLAQFDSEQDGELKARAAVSFVRQSSSNGPIEFRCIPRLRKMLSAVGYDYQERRQAAFAALSELREFTAISDEFINHFRNGNVLFERGLSHHNETVWRQLVKHWKQLRDALGDKDFAEFTYNRSPLSFANQLVSFIDDEGPARAWVLDLCSSAESIGTSLGLLDYLPHTEPRSERLLSQCVSVLHKKVETPLYGWADQLQIASLFASHWGGDKDALAKLVDDVVPSAIPELVAIALTIGWPDSEELASYQKAAAKEKRRVSWHLWHALAAVFASPEQLVKHINRCALIRGGDNKNIFREAMKYYRIRIRRDEEARNVLLHTLKCARNSDVRVTLAGILARAAPEWSGFKAWRTQQIETIEPTILSAEFGYNLATSEVENLFAILVEP